MRAAKASAKNARNDMLMAAADESLNMSSCDSRNLFVNGTADEADDIKR